MTGIAYDEKAAAAFQASRQLAPDGLSHWRTAIARYLVPLPGTGVLDLGVRNEA